MPIPRLQGPPEHVLELEPLRYQYAHTADSTSGFDWDANWVVVRFVVQDSHRSWSSIDPAFLTTELQELVVWLRAVANNESVEPTFTPLQHLVSFEVRSTDAGPTLRASFALELEPRTGNPWLDFDLEREELQRFADDLAASIERFPPR
jgi:hypothetical protein